MGIYQRLLEKPVDQEFFTRFSLIYSVDDSNSPVMVKIQNSADENGEIEYCDKILAGETIESALRRSLLNDFGLRLISYRILEFHIDTVSNKFGHPQTRFPVETYVEYEELKTTPIKGSLASWIDRPDAIRWLENNSSIAMLGSKNNVERDSVQLYIEKLYQAGAVFIDFDEYELTIEPEEQNHLFNPDMLTIEMPNDPTKRKNIFSTLNNDLDNNHLVKEKVTDSGQQSITCHF